MNDLLTRVLEAHGGLERFNSFEIVSATLVAGGDFWATKNIGIDAFPLVATTAIHREWATVAPYGDPKWRMNFAPDRVEVKTTENVIVAERNDPGAAFKGHGLKTPSDPLHLAYFNGYTLWTYLTTPFLIAMPGFEVDEIAPWHEGGESWRVLRATFPSEIASHCRQQEFYFGPNFLLRRHDYQVDVSGGFLVAHYVYDFKEFNGFRFPTRRRAHARNADLQADFSHTLVWIDLSDFQLSCGSSEGPL